MSKSKVVRPSIFEKLDLIAGTGRDASLESTKEQREVIKCAIKKKVSLMALYLLFKEEYDGPCKAVLRRWMKEVKEGKGS